MTRQETLRLLSVVKTAYPGFCRGFGSPELEAVVRLWQELFSRVPYEMAHMAALEFIAEDARGFPPSPGAILLRCRQATNRAAQRPAAGKAAEEAISEIRSFYHRRGLPSPSEAKNRGISFEEWKAAAAAADEKDSPPQANGLFRGI